MGHSPRLTTVAQTEVKDHEMDTATVDISEAQDNLLMAKINQAEFANHHHAAKTDIQAGDQVMLSTKHCCCEIYATVQWSIHYNQSTP
jgi:hypothetical protein